MESEKPKTHRAVTEADYSDERSDWWVVGPADGYSLEKKMQRVGCQPVLREYVRCSADREREFSHACQVLPADQKTKVQLEDCQKVLQYFAKQSKTLAP